MTSGKAVEQHWFSRRALALPLDGSGRQAVPATVTRLPERRLKPGAVRLADLAEMAWVGPLGYPLTVTDCVDTGPAPAPGNADPTPLNITTTADKQRSA
jgi:hypothetical protein